MYRLATFVLFVAFGIVFQQSHGIEVNVIDKDKKLCLYANLMVNFSVSYAVAGNKSATVNFELPATTTSEGSVCDTANSLLKLDFGKGHSWSMNFTINETMYQADTITFSYNLSDSTFFPNSTSNETATVVKHHIIDVDVDTCYSCKSKDVIQADHVSQTLWNVLIQAFVSNGSKSENLTVCAADLPITTAAPTTNATSTPTAAPTTNATSTPTAAPTTNATSTPTAAPTTNATSTPTAAPTTNATSTPTAAPVTNATSTTPPPTTTPAPPLPTPTTGKYIIKTEENGTVCLLANFGLRIGLQQANIYEINLEPNETTATGLCGGNSSKLVLVYNYTTIILTFVNDTKKFRLHALNVTGKTSSGVPFSEVNANLSLWEAALGNSYMCNKEQNYTITSLLTLYTFNLQVQPFGVKKDEFSTAHECSMDDVSILIPIIVGVALAGLILIVVIAYVIGRRKTYVGYQTL